MKRDPEEIVADWFCKIKINRDIIFKGFQNSLTFLTRYAWAKDIMLTPSSS